MIDINSSHSLVRKDTDERIYTSWVDLNNLILEIKTYYIFYRMSDKSVPVQLANSYMHLVLAELEKVNQELIEAHDLPDAEYMSQDYRVKDKDLYWKSDRMAKELIEFRERMSSKMSSVFALYKMQGVRFTLYEVHLNQVITLYKLDSETL